MAGFRKILGTAIAAACLVAIGSFAPTPVFACQNFVGGVCLDKKNEPAKKKKVRKKAAPKKKAVVKKKAAPKPRTARECLSVQEKAGLLRRWGDRRISYVFTNNCARPIKILLISNPCYAPRGHFEKTRSIPRWKTEVGAKKRKTISVVQSEKLYKARAKGIHGNYVFADDPKARRAGFPKWPTGCATSGTATTTQNY